MSAEVTTEEKKTGGGSLLKFVLFSLFGIWLFFVPMDAKGQAPIVILVGYCVKTLGNAGLYLPTISSIVLFGTYVLSKVTNNPTLKKMHESDSPFYGFLFFLAAIFPIMVLAGVGPEQLLNEKVAPVALKLSRTVMMTTFLAGWLVIFLMKSGIVDFIGILIEPIMRPLFKLPGEAAVNALTAFVSAPAVGVYFTNKLYEDNVYTQKEAIAVITNFSVCSIGFFGVLVGVGEVPHLYSKVVLTTLLLTFVMGMFVIRVPLISLKKNIYKNGEMQTPELLEQRRVELNKGSRFERAMNVAIAKSGELTVDAFKANLIGAAMFTQKIVAFVISVATLTLWLVTFTNVFNYIGFVMEPYLNLFGIANAAALAPSTLIGITDMTLPVTLLVGKGLPEASVFFIIVLSALQVIFFTGSATAMLEMDVPLNMGELVVLFIMRTLIAIPLVALVVKFLF